MTRPGKLRVMLDATVRAAGALSLCGGAGQAGRAHGLSRVSRRAGELSLSSIELVPDPAPEEVAAHRGLVRDETDVPVVPAALNARVDCLVSEDKDLTAQDDTTTALRGKLTVRLSGTFLREVLGWDSEQLEAVRGRSWSELGE